MIPLTQVRKSFQRYFSLSDEEMMIILNYFLYGNKITAEENEVIENLMKSEKYFMLLERLVKNYAEAEIDIRSMITSNVPVYNLVGSYKLWRKYDPKGRGRKAEQGMEGLDAATIELFKVKYLKTLLTQYRWGQMIPMIDWPGKQIHHVGGGADFGTDIGQCEALVGFVHKEDFWDYSAGPLKLGGSFPGEANGMTLMLDAEAFDVGVSSSPATGIQVAIFYYLDVPIMTTSGINLDVGTYTKLGLSAKIIETSPEAKRTLTPERRGCFFEDEIRLQDINSDVGGRYEMTNCLFQATADQIRQRCKCDPAYWLIAPNMCVGPDVACLKEVNSELGKYNEVVDTLTNTTKKCIAACEATSFSDTMISTSSYPSGGSFMFTKESCILAKKLISTCEDERRVSLQEWYPNICNQIEYLKRTNSFCIDNEWRQASLKNKSDFDFTEFSSTLTKYAKENIAFVKIYLREPFAEVLKVSVKTTVLDYIANIGGLMGVCMGFSLVTLAEILYHVIDGIWAKYFSSGERTGSFKRRDNRKIAAK